MRGLQCRREPDCQPRPRRDHQSVGHPLVLFLAPIWMALFFPGLADPKDGHLIRYVRRVMGTSERIEINVQLRVLDGAGASR